MNIEYRNVAVFCGAITLLILIAFGPTYFGPLFSGELELPWVVHSHGLLMMTWCGLTIAQAGLAARGRFDLHRRLGLSSLVLYFLIVVTTTAAIVRSTDGLNQAVVEVLRRYDLVLFAAAYAAAFVLRRRPEFHRRFMVVALLGVLPPAWSRFHYFQLRGFEWLDPGQSAIVLVDSLLIALALRDRWQIGQWQMAYPIALGVAGGLQMVSYAI